MPTKYSPLIYMDMYDWMCVCVCVSECLQGYDFSMCFNTHERVKSFIPLKGKGFYIGLEAKIISNELLNMGEENK